MSRQFWTLMVEFKGEAWDKNDTRAWLQQITQALVAEETDYRITGFHIVDVLDKNSEDT